MSELQAYYDAFRTGYWAHPDARECRCGGSGWALSEVDTLHTCRYHYRGQPHPEDSEEAHAEWELAEQRRAYAKVVGRIVERFGVLPSRLVGLAREQLPYGPLRAADWLEGIQRVEEAYIEVQESREP